MSVLLINDIVYMPEQTLLAAAGKNNDVDLQSSILIVVPPSAGVILTGFVPPIANNAFCILANAGADDIVLNNNDSGSTSGYRLLLPTGKTTLTLAAGERTDMFFVPGSGWHVGKDGTFA